MFPRRNQTLWKGVIRSKLNKFLFQQLIHQPLLCYNLLKIVDHAILSKSKAFVSRIGITTNLYYQQQLS